MSVFSKKRKDGSTAWFYRFNYKGVPYCEMAGATKTQALRAQEKIRASLIDGTYRIEHDIKNPTFKDFSVKFLKRREHNKSHWRDVISVNHLDNYFKKNTTLGSIYSQDVEDYKSWRKSQGVANATVNRELGCLKRMFNLAIKWGDARNNPVVGVGFLKEQKQMDNCLNQKEAWAIIDSCADYFRPIVIIALNTGMRLNELLTLTWKQVNLDQGYIELINTKNNEKRYPTLNDTAISCLTGIKRRSEYVFIGTRNQPLKSIIKPWASAKKKTNINPGFRFHDLRHTFISHSIMKGVDLFTIARQVGHTDLRQIEQRYGHLLAEHRKKAVHAIDGMFAPAESRSYIAPGAKILNLGDAVST